MGEKRVTLSKKMGDVTHFMEGYFYVGCRFIGAGDSWHSSKIIRADEKNARII
jgi:hypothetical protein